ncbi:hypothetical protein AMS68_008069 [Peltaster fructicola]|uniref:Indole-diterpene biosynthesis protein PaxU n=1 Tax=Peltaster fructicola TaxID=286661 RepID=A0A6H0Y670_9PEZI|nr:hypothetical protein AMS68_008069 [Peltaster fructicola]
MATSEDPPLAFMTRLSNAIHLYDANAADVDAALQPRLIILLGWMDARDTHLAKYILEYRTRYPQSSILLIRSRVAIMVSAALARAEVEPALPVIARMLSKGDKAELLVHAFSNGGSCLLSNLNAALPEGLPLHVTIFDSSPSMQYNRAKTVSAVMAGIPRGMMYYVSLPVVNVVSYAWAFQVYVLGVADTLSDLAASHNDREKVHESRRVYIYSDADQLIDKEDVELHALQAQQKGFNVIEEVFVGSPHVAHSRSDPKRYWRIVEDAWRG